MYHSVELITPLVDSQLLHDVAPHTKYFSNSMGKKILANSSKTKVPDYIINKSKTGWTAPINLWRLQFQKECKEINKIASQMADYIKLPEDKRWAPILHFVTWQKIFNMNI